TPRLYWCSFDIAKFYPSVSLELVRSVLLSRSLMAQAIGPKLLGQLTSFSIDLTGWSKNEIADMGLGVKESTCPFIPTGLSVAGFLANTAMLSVDNWVREESRKQQVAHF